MSSESWTPQVMKTLDYGNGHILFQCHCSGFQFEVSNPTRRPCSLLSYFHCLPSQTVWPCRGLVQGGESFMGTLAAAGTAWSRRPLKTYNSSEIGNSISESIQDHSYRVSAKDWMFVYPLACTKFICWNLILVMVDTHHYIFLKT